MITIFCTVVLSTDPENGTDTQEFCLLIRQGATVMDWPSQYHAILGRPAFAKFMAVPHYAYLTLKIPGPKGIITVQGSFEVANTCDREFNRIAQTFGMTAKYERLKGETDHNVLPDVGRSLPDQAFDATQDSKKIQVHPTDPNKTTSIAVNLDPA